MRSSEDQALCKALYASTYLGGFFLSLVSQCDSSALCQVQGSAGVAFQRGTEHAYKRGRQKLFCGHLQILQRKQNGE